MPIETPEHRTFSAQLDCHYLLAKPDVVDERTLLVTTLHGYGMNAGTMLRLTASWFPEQLIAAVQGPSSFFLSAGTPASEVGFSWVTRDHAASWIRLHHEMLLRVMDEVGQQYRIPPERRLLVGFSQPVGLNYRFAATHPDAVRGVIGICGGMPGNWEQGPYRKVSAALLHIARREDEFYAPGVTEQFPNRLRLRADDVEFHMLDGGHRFPSKAKPIVDSWIERVFTRK